MNGKNSSNETTINKTIVEPMVNDLPEVPTPSPPNDMLSFEEWRKKIAEKSAAFEKESVAKIAPQVVSQSSQSVPPVVQTVVTTKPKPTKRSRNFASYECGAKVVDSNPESESVQRILNEQTDEYMLNPCKAKIWFVVQMCETIQPKSIEIANFELYSSVPKEFNIQASDHYPSREWSSLGTFSTLDERSVQRFQLQDNGFAKFIKIEMLSHYGSEHFCPLSVIRIFGTSLFEEVERMDNMDENHNQIVATDEDNESPLNEELVGEGLSSQNLFGSARDAVFNIVRKAAQALNGNNNEVLESDSNQNTSSIINALIDYNVVAIRLYPKVDKYLNNCNKTSNDLINCLYLKTIFGQTLYELLIEQYLSLNVMNTSEKRLLFQCDSQPKNKWNQSLKIESSVDLNHNLGVISPTKPIISEIKSNSMENITSDSDSLTTTSEEMQISVTQTQSSQDVSTSSESSILTTLSSDSTASELKSEDLFTNSVNNSNKVLNESSILNTKSEDIIKNVTTNDITVPISVPQQTTGQTPVAQNGNNGYSGSTGGQSKESVVIRLSNRIKALEVNLSLSSQYLEELSQRYRKQMEEMQRAFNITISKLNDTNNRATERDLKQQESIALLETKLNLLNTEMSVLLRERESLNWHYIEVHIALMMIEVIIVIVFLFICVHRLSQRIQSIQTFSESKQQKPSINSFHVLSEMDNNRNKESFGSSLPVLPSARFAVHNHRRRLAPGLSYLSFNFRKSSRSPHHLNRIKSETSSTGRSKPIRIDERRLTESSDSRSPSFADTTRVSPLKERRNEDKENQLLSSDLCFNYSKNQLII